MCCWPGRSRLRPGCAHDYFRSLPNCRTWQSDGLVLRRHSGWQRPGLRAWREGAGIHSRSRKLALGLFPGTASRHSAGPLVLLHEGTGPGTGRARRVCPRKATREDLWVLLRTPSYVLCSLGMTAMTFAMGGIAYWLPYYLIRVHHMKEDQANFRFGLIVVLSGLSATILGGILRRSPATAFCRILFLGIRHCDAGGFSADLARISYGWLLALWLCIFMACFALFFNTGPTNTILANVTHPQIRATPSPSTSL